MNSAAVIEKLELKFEARPIKLGVVSKGIGIGLLVAAGMFILGYLAAQLSGREFAVQLPLNLTAGLTMLAAGAFAALGLKAGFAGSVPKVLLCGGIASVLMGALLFVIMA